MGAQINVLTNEEEKTIIFVFEKISQENNELPCVQFKRTSYTANKKWQKVQNNINQYNFAGTEESRPDPQLKTLSPNFFWMRRCHRNQWLPEAVVWEEGRVIKIPDTMLLSIVLLRSFLKIFLKHCTLRKSHFLMVITQYLTYNSDTYRLTNHKWSRKGCSEDPEDSPCF